MRVLHLTWEFPPHLIGGLGRHVADLTPALAAAGVAVTVVTPHLAGGAPDEWLAAVHIHRVETAGTALGAADMLVGVQAANQAMLAACQRLRETHGPFDLIHAHDWLAAECAIALKTSWQCPLLVTIHATERGRGNGYLVGPASQQIDQIERQLCQAADHIIVCSQFMANELHQHFAVELHNTTVIANGVTPQPSPFTDDVERLIFRRRFASDADYLLFFVGRVVYEKGIQLLIQAIASLRNEWPIHLVIAGRGPYLEDLRRLAQQLDLADEVIFAGFISDDDRERFYRVADAAVFPSFYEPFGIVALEAFAAGCPVIASRTGGLAEVIIAHQSGILVEANNLGSLVWGVRHSLEHPDWAAARAANALRIATLDYTWAGIAQSTLRVYRDLLNTRIT